MKRSKSTLKRRVMRLPLVDPKLGKNQASVAFLGRNEKGEEKGKEEKGAVGEGHGGGEEMGREITRE